MRLLTIHNLAYLQRLMAELRDAIDAGRLAEVAAAVRRRGAAPWELAACDAFKAFEAAGWSARAGTYDALMARATAFAIEPLLDAAGSARACACSTSAAGSGRSRPRRPRAARRSPASTSPTGMLAEARRRHPDIEFVHADAEALPFADGAFDVALGAFVVNHLPHPERAAAELAASPAASRSRCGARRTRSRILGLPARAARDLDANVPPGPGLAQRFTDARRARAADRRHRHRARGRRCTSTPRRAVGRRPRRHRPHRRPPRRRAPAAAGGRACAPRRARRAVPRRRPATTLPTTIRIARTTPPPPPPPTPPPPTPTPPTPPPASDVAAVAVGLADLLAEEEAARGRRAGVQSPSQSGNVDVRDDLGDGPAAVAVGAVRAVLSAQTCSAQGGIDVLRLRRRDRALRVMRSSCEWRRGVRGTGCVGLGAGARCWRSCPPSPPDGNAPVGAFRRRRADGSLPMSAWRRCSAWDGALPRRSRVTDYPGPAIVPGASGGARGWCAPARPGAGSRWRTRAAALAARSRRRRARCGRVCRGEAVACSRCRELGGTRAAAPASRQRSAQARRWAAVGARGAVRATSTASSRSCASRAARRGVRTPRIEGFMRQVAGRARRTWLVGSSGACRSRHARLPGPAHVLPLQHGLRPAAQTVARDRAAGRADRALDRRRRRALRLHARARALQARVGATPSSLGACGLTSPTPAPRAQQAYGAEDVNAHRGRRPLAVASQRGQDLAMVAHRLVARRSS